MSYELVPVWLQELSEVVRTITIIAGVILIPLFIWIRGKLTEKRRATLELIRSLATDEALHERTSRFYRYRFYKTGVEGAINPYKEIGTHAFAHDCLFILNYYDVACIEILNGMVDEDMLYKTSRDPIARAPIVLDELNTFLGEDKSGAYLQLLEISHRWNERALKEKSPISRPLAPERLKEAARGQGQTPARDGTQPE